MNADADAERIAAGLHDVLRRRDDAARAAGRRPDDVALVAVSKTHPPEAVSAAAAASQTVFGESRVQEARAKIPLCSSRLEWHFIGRLQKNKVRQALPLFTLFHGVDSIELAEAMNCVCREEGLRARILLEINVAGESSKFGFSPASVAPVFPRLAACERLDLAGLMAIPPPVPKPELARTHFAFLRELREQLQAETGAGLPELSMGMTGDFEVAIAEGATMIRVGTAIFGERTAKTWRPTESSDHDDG